MKDDDRLVIMAWDPGGTTGWAALSILLRHIPLFQREGLEALRRDIVDLNSGQLAGSERRQVDEAYDLVEAGIASGRANHVVFLYEDFILRKHLKSRELLAPVRMGARLETLNQINWRFTELIQQPSLAKTATPDKALRRYGIHSPGKPHANDAKRHAVTLVRRFAAKPAFLQATIERSKW